MRLHERPWELSASSPNFVIMKSDDCFCISCLGPRVRVELLCAVICTVTFASSLESSLSRNHAKRNQSRKWDFLAPFNLFSSAHSQCFEVRTALVRVTVFIPGLLCKYGDLRNKLRVSQSLIMGIHYRNYMNDERHTSTLVYTDTMLDAKDNRRASACAWCMYACACHSFTPS